MSELTDLRAENSRLRRDNQKLRARLARAGNSFETRRLRKQAERITMIRHCAREVYEYEHPDGWQTIPNQEGRRRWKNLMEQINYVPS